MSVFQCLDEPLSLNETNRSDDCGESHRDCEEIEKVDYHYREIVRLTACESTNESATESLKKIQKLLRKEIALLSHRTRRGKHGFNTYMSERHSDLSPGWKWGENTRVIAEQWKKISAIERSEYNSKARCKVILSDTDRKHHQLRKLARDLKKKASLECIVLLYSMILMVLR